MHYVWNLALPLLLPLVLFVSGQGIPTEIDAEQDIMARQSLANLPTAFKAVGHECDFDWDMGIIAQDDVFVTVNASCPGPIDFITLSFYSYGISQLEEITTEYGQGNANAIAENYPGTVEYCAEALVGFYDDDDLVYDTSFICEDH